VLLGTPSALLASVVASLPPVQFWLIRLSFIPRMIGSAEMIPTMCQRLNQASRHLSLSISPAAKVCEDGAKRWKESRIFWKGFEILWKDSPSPWKDGSTSWKVGLNHLERHLK
jgi:hypothetical protein